MAGQNVTINKRLAVLFMALKQQTQFVPLGVGTGQRWHAQPRPEPRPRGKKTGATGFGQRLQCHWTGQKALYRGAVGKHHLMRGQHHMPIADHSSACRLSDAIQSQQLFGGNKNLRGAEQTLGNTRGDQDTMLGRNPQCDGR